jgi:hypothetical protein
MGRQPIPAGFRGQVQATTAHENTAPMRDLSNTFIPLHDSTEGQEGAPDSISSWIALSPYRELSGFCEELSSKMAFNLVKRFIDEAPLTKQFRLCEVLVNDVKKQILADKDRMASNPFILEPTTHGKTIRAAMEIIAEKDAEADMGDFSFSDLMQQLENFRRDHRIDYSTSWGEEDV